jgi:hypothetical protein
MSGGLAQNPQGFGGQAPGGLGNNIFGGASPAMQNPMQSPMQNPMTQALQRIFSGLGPQGMPPPVMGYPSPRGVGMQTPPGAIPR